MINRSYTISGIMPFYIQKKKNIGGVVKNLFYCGNGHWSPNTESKVSYNTQEEANLQKPTHGTVVEE